MAFEKIDPNQLQDTKAFTRRRKLSREAVVCEMIAESLNGSLFGADLIQKSLLQLDVHRSSLCRAKAKLSKNIFDDLIHQLSGRNERQVQWHGHNVRAADGTYVILPKSEDILKAFPVHRPHKEHYPKALCFAAINAFTGQPIATEVGPYNSSEHSHLYKVLEQFKPGDITLLDRYFHSQKVFAEFFKREQFFVIRAKVFDYPNSLASQLKRSHKNEIIVKTKIADQTRQLRLIKAGSRGRSIVLITNLIDKKRYKRPEIISLYKKRWEVETFFLRLKQHFGTQKWHTKTAQGIRLEIAAHCLALSLVAAHVFKANRSIKPDFKINFRAAQLVFIGALIRPMSTAKLRAMLSRCLIKNQSGRSYPRYSKQPSNRWIGRHRPSKQFISKENRKKGYWKARH